MKLNIIGGIAVSALLLAATLTQASAADMPLKAPPPPPAPVYSWSACYIGANGGGAWARKDTIFSTIAGTVVNEDEGRATPRGGAYGGQIGCDYQVNSYLVLGIRGCGMHQFNGRNSWPTVPTFSNNYKIDLSEQYSAR